MMLYHQKIDLLLSGVLPYLVTTGTVNPSLHLKAPWRGGRLWVWAGPQADLVHQLKLNRVKEMLNN